VIEKGKMSARCLRHDGFMDASPPAISATEIDSVVANLRRVMEWERSIARRRITSFSRGRSPLLERQYAQKGLESCAYQLIARFIVGFAGPFFIIGFALIFTKGNSSLLLGIEILCFVLCFLTITYGVLRFRQGIRAGRRFSISPARD
jgi:hypothetical protein